MHPLTREGLTVPSTGCAGARYRWNVPCDTAGGRSPDGRRPAGTRPKLAEAPGIPPTTVIRLAYHAALPVVIDAGLLNLLRVNFFLDPPDVLPFEAGAELLLSPLFREIGNDLYEIDPEVRNILLIGLQTTYKSERVRQVAQLLMHYTYSTPAWTVQPELEQAQQLTALSFVDPARAGRGWTRLSAGRRRGPQPRMVRRHAPPPEAQPRASSASDEVARAAARLTDRRLEARLSAVQTLAALAQLPGTDVDPIAGALAGLVRLRRAKESRREPGRGHPGRALRPARARRRLRPPGHLAERAGARRPAGAVLVTGERSELAPADDEILAELAPLFFVSHALQALGRRYADARRERSLELVQFFDDLSENVAELVALSAGRDPGFLDRTIPGGTHWTGELLRAVGTCQAFVALLSPQYFASAWCGMEWNAFSLRTVARRAPGVLDSRRSGHYTGIVLVNWTPVQAREIPPVVSAVQRFSPAGLPDPDISPPVRVGRGVRTAPAGAGRCLRGRCVAARAAHCGELLQLPGPAPHPPAERSARRLPGALTCRGGTVPRRVRAAGQVLLSQLRALGPAPRPSRGRSRPLGTPLLS